MGSEAARQPKRDVEFAHPILGTTRQPPKIGKVDLGHASQGMTLRYRPSLLCGMRSKAVILARRPTRQVAKLNMLGLRPQRNVVSDENLPLSLGGHLSKM